MKRWSAKVFRQPSTRGWFAKNPTYTAFFDALLDGRLALGQTLTQDALCAVLGTSLSPLREADPSRGGWADLDFAAGSA